MRRGGVRVIRRDSLHGGISPAKLGETVREAEQMGDKLIYSGVNSRDKLIRQCTPSRGFRMMSMVPVLNERRTAGPSTAQHLDT